MLVQDNIKDTEKDNLNDDFQISDGITASRSQSEWDESALAKLTGASGFTDIKEENSNLEQQAVNIPRDPNISNDPRENKTVVPLSENGYARGVLVAVAMAGVFGLAGLFYYSSTLTSQKPIAIVPEKEETTKPEKVEDSEIGDLKTKLALQSQYGQIQATNIKPEREPVVQKPVITQPVVEPPPPPPPAPPVQQHSYNRTPPPPPPKVDGKQKWQELAGFGSFHYQTNNVAPPVSSNPTPTRYIANNRRILPGEEQRVIERIPSQSLPPGGKIEGILRTAIFWGGMPTDTFTVDVTQDVKQGSRTLVKAGDRIIIKVQNIANSGLVNAIPTKLIRNGKSVSLPRGLVVRKRNLDPLVARLESPNNSGVAEAFKLFALGSLSKVGEVINRPDSFTSTSTSNGSFSSSTVTNNSNRSVVGGVLEGGMQPLLGREMQRSQQKYQQLLQAEQFWFVPGNKAVTIYANSAVNIPIVR